MSPWKALRCFAMLEPSQSHYLPEDEDSIYCILVFEHELDPLPKEVVLRIKLNTPFEHL